MVQYRYNRIESINQAVNQSSRQSINRSINELSITSCALADFLADLEVDGTLMATGERITND